MDAQVQMAVPGSGGARGRRVHRLVPAAGGEEVGERREK